MIESYTLSQSSLEMISSFSKSLKLTRSYPKRSEDNSNWNYLKSYICWSPFYTRPRIPGPEPITNTLLMLNTWHQIPYSYYAQALDRTYHHNEPKTSLDFFFTGVCPKIVTQNLPKTIWETWSENSRSLPKYELLFTRSDTTQPENYRKFRERIY